MLETLYILQIAVGILMIVALGIWLFVHFRWHNASGGNLEPEKKSRLKRYMTLIVICLVVPNFLLIILTRVLS